MEQVYYLYKITNNINGKIYIGITRDPKQREYQHFNMRSVKWNSLIAKAVDKYGKENFTFEVICIGNREYISDLENKAISLYKSLVPNGYNIKPGGETVLSGYNISKRINDKPIFVSGFWFPNLRTCALKLNKDKTTILKWIKSGVVGDLIKSRKLRGDSLDLFPCYVGGFWFTSITQASQSLNVSRSTLSKRIKAGFIEQQDNKSLVKGKDHPNAIPVKIDGIEYSSVLEASKLSGYTYRVIQNRLKNNKEGFLFLK